MCLIWRSKIIILLTSSPSHWFLSIPCKLFSLWTSESKIAFVGAGLTDVQIQELDSGGFEFDGSTFYKIAQDLISKGESVAIGNLKNIDLKVGTEVVVARLGN